MKYSNIGGQAVMEGVMMRNGENYAVAVRTVDGKIAVEKKVHHALINNKKIQGLPIVRGIINFVDSLVLGMSSLMLSAEYFAEETVEETKERLAEEEKKTNRKAEKLRAAGKEAEAQKLLADFAARAQEEITKAEKGGVTAAAAKEGKGQKKEEDNSLLMGITVVLSLALSIGLFMFLPYLLASLLRRLGAGETVVALGEAVLRMLIFFTYMYLISRMKDIQRTFMYHGAEHKCINCIENGLELNVQNVRNSSRQHKRCGTSFLLYVMVISVIFQLFFVFVHITNPFLRIGIRLLMIPLIAGIAYEFIRMAGKSDNKCVNLFSKPGLALQRLTTKEPDDSQIEVGIASVEAIFNWKKYLNENFGAHYVLEPEEDGSGA